MRSALRLLAPGDPALAASGRLADARRHVEAALSGEDAHEHGRRRGALNGHLERQREGVHLGPDSSCARTALARGRDAAASLGDLAFRRQDAAAHLELHAEAGAGSGEVDRGVRVAEHVQPPRHPGPITGPEPDRREVVAGAAVYLAAARVAGLSEPQRLATLLAGILRRPQETSWRR